MIGAYRVVMSRLLICQVEVFFAEGDELPLLARARVLVEHLRAIVEVYQFNLPRHAQVGQLHFYVVAHKGATAEDLTKVGPHLLHSRASLHAVVLHALLVETDLQLRVIGLDESVQHPFAQLVLDDDSRWELELVVPLVGLYLQREHSRGPICKSQ